MSDLLQHFDSPREVAAAAQRLRERALELELTPSQVIDILERWGESLRGAGVDEIPGVAFLRLWLRRGTLEPIVVRELGVEGLNGEWHEERTARLRAYPLGVIGHWPAGNIEIQPLLSLSCALLGGNASLVRVPAGLVAQTRALLETLSEVSGASSLLERICVASFEHERADLQRAMAAAVDGAMIWGGAEAVTRIRALPFPPWARIAVFGPRLSVAAMDGESWSGGPDRDNWCRRLARDVWQFDQQACSSPQALFLERCTAGDLAEFAATLGAAFEAENRLHPRESIHPALTSAICLARASWLLDDSTHRALFPATPDWTLLLGADSRVPSPTQGRTLSVVQTLGLAVSDEAKEATLTQAAARSGVDRIVKLGRMHIFGSPWDGADLVRPMVRLVRHVPAHAD